MEIDITNEEEKRINDILDSGINQFKKTKNSYTSIPFNSFKEELNSLQSNIDKLEKKLFVNPNISYASPSNAYQTLISFDKSNENKYDIDNIVDKTKQIFYNKREDNIQYNTSKDKYKPNHDESILLERENREKDIIINNLKQELEEYKKSNEYTIINLQNELSKYRKDKELLNKIIYSENQKFLEITDENKNNLFTVSNQLKDTFIKYEELQKEYTYLEHQYSRSEKIRIEQNNLIKQLQNDINILRNKHTEDIPSFDISNEIENPFLKNTTTPKKQVKKTPSKIKK